MDTGLMIIELRKYNSAEELLIGLRSAGLQWQVLNRNTERRTSVTMVAVCMRGTGDGARDRIPGSIQMTPDLGMREGMEPPVLEPEKGHQ